MLHRRAIGQFVKSHIAREFPDFRFFRTKDLVRVRRPLLQGIVFSQSEWSDVFYVHCFVHFLTEPKDFLALTFGERMLRPGHELGTFPPPERSSEEWTSAERKSFMQAVQQSHRAESFGVEPAEEEASLLLEAMRRSPYSPFNFVASCANVLKLGEGRRPNEHIDYGMGTCAIFENDPGLARYYFGRAKEILRDPTEDWHRELLDRVLTIDALVNDLAAAKTKLMTWVEESIRLLKLGKIA